MTAATVSIPVPPVSSAPASSAARLLRAPAGGLRIMSALVRATLLGFVREPVGFVMQFLYPLFMLFIFHAVFPG